MTMKMLNVAGGFVCGVGLGLVALVAWLAWAAGREELDERRSVYAPSA